MKQQILSLLLAWGFSYCLNAQRIPLAATEFETPGIKAGISNSADHFWNFYNTAAFEVPRGIDRHTNYAHSLWIGGLDPSGQLHVAANTYRQTGIDFYSGPVLPNPVHAYGRGFDMQGRLSTYRQLLAHPSGKFVLVHGEGYQVYDPQANTAVDYIFLQARPGQNSVMLPDGSVFMALMNSPQNPASAAVCYRFNPLMQSQTTVIADSGHRCFPFLTALPDGRIWVQSVLSSQIFDPQTNQIQNFPISGLQLRGNAVPFANDSVLIFAGGVGSNYCGGASPIGHSTATQLVDIGTQTAVPGPSMLFSRLRPLALRGQNGDLYIFGGSEFVNAVERYNPQTQSFELAGTIDSTGRVTDGVALPDGSFLISTWRPNDPIHAALYRYDPVTQTAKPLQLIAGGPRIAMNYTGRVAFQSDPERVSLLTMDYRTIQDEPYQYIWKVSAAEIDAFKQDFALGQVDFSRYPDIATWPGNGRTGIGEPAQLAPYEDVDQNGVYAPALGGDYPCIRGDYAAWSVYNDLGPHGETGGQALGVEVENMSWAVDCSLRPCPDPDMAYVLFQHLEITNRSQLDYQQLYLGGFFDFDIGYAFDDFVGCDTSLGLAFGYNADNNDDGATGYGMAPPASGALILPNGDVDRMDHMQYFNNDFTVIGNPENAQQFYGYLKSIWKDGNHLVNDGGDGYAPGGVPFNYAFPGNPAFCGGFSNGWYEPNNGQPAYDRRVLQSSGPHDLLAGQRINLDYAIVYGRGTSNLRSVCELKANSAALLAWWPTLQASFCTEPPLAVDDPVRNELGLHLAPNPATTHAQLRLDAPLRTRTALRVCDLAGRVHMQASLAAGTKVHDFDVQALPASMYLVQLQSAGGHGVQRLVVQR